MKTALGVGGTSGLGFELAKKLKTEFVLSYPSSANWQIG